MTEASFNTHGVIFDELHTQPNRKLYDVMTQGSGDARMQPLYFLITTAGNDTNSICYEIHQKALDIEAGRKIDPTFYSVIYGADESEDWTDPKVWKKANPSLGITVGIDKVKAACESARQNPGEENSFRQLRLNQWVKQSVRWMPMEKWDACAFPADEEELDGRVCYGGLDLSSTTDITAFCLVFPPRDEEDKYSVLPYFWIPEDSLDLRVRRDHVPYDVWEKQGFLQTTEGNVVHYGYIEKFIERLGERFNIREIAFDRWGAVQMVQNLEGMTRAASCLYRRVCNGHIQQSVPFTGPSRQPHGGQRVQLPHERKFQREVRQRAERHADDGGLFLRQDTLRGSGKPAAPCVQIHGDGLGKGV